MKIYDGLTDIFPRTLTTGKISTHYKKLHVQKSKITFDAYIMRLFLLKSTFLSVRYSNYSIEKHRFRQKSGDPTIR